MTDQFFTIPRQATSEMKVKGSRFIGAALPQSSVEQIDNTLTEFRKNYHDASHNCFAWQVGIDSAVSFKYSDDGEPSGTAGKPIYDCITGRQLTDVLVVVTRYFGGTRLGTGGLVRAYSDAAIAALETAGRVERFVMETVAIVVDFTFYDAIRKLIAELGATETDAQFTDQVRLAMQIRAGMMPRLRDALVQATNGRVEFVQ